MTQDELRTKYNAAYRIVIRERAMRNAVFPVGHPQRDEKLAEIDKLLGIVTELKDALKPHCEPVFEQPKLLDVPAGPERRAEFR